ncbi:MAG: TVP38/TMEM64 family protein [Desulfovibrionaceae bacterium]
MKKYTIIIIALLAVVALSFDLAKYLTFENLKEYHENLQTFYNTSPASFAASFFVLYVLAATLYFPGIIILDIASGSIMGFQTAVFVDSFASATGATGALLVSRYIARDSIKKIFPKQYEKINANIVKEGGMYLLTMRLVPLFPFIVVNAIMGITSYSLRKYYIISQIGMLPATIIVTKIGEELSEIEKPSQLFTPTLFILLFSLAIIPWIARIFLRKYLPPK